MAVNPTDVFKAVATPSPELQRLLAYAAENGSVQTGIRPGRNEKENTESGRKDMTMTALQISEQERIHQQYQEQSAQINQAIELALAEAKTPEEQQEILNYQNELQTRRDEIEAKRNAGMDVTEDQKAYLEYADRNMPELVRQQPPVANEQASKVIDNSELDSLAKYSGTSVAASVDSAKLAKQPNINQPFQDAASDQPNSDIKPPSPLDTPKFTI